MDNSNKLQRQIMAFMISVLMLTVSLISISHVNADTQKDSNIVTSTWGDAPVTFDKSSGTLTVGSGMVTNDLSNGYVDDSKTIFAYDVKHIDFKKGSMLPPDAKYMFGQAGPQNGSIKFGNLISIDGVVDTSNVTNMKWMFYANVSLQSLNFLKSFDTSNVTNMNGMFSGASDYMNFKDLDVSSFNTAKVTDMSQMFMSQRYLQKLDLSNFNTEHVTDMSDMFSRNGALKDLNISSFNTDSVTNYESFFGYAPIQTIKLGNHSIFSNRQYGDPQLADIEKTNDYTGRWTRINPVSPESIYNSSDNFMAQYDGKQPGTYVWEKVSQSGGPVTVNYVDENGNNIADPVVKSGNVGDKYSTEQKEINDYTFKEVQGNATGTFTADAQTVTYVYTKNPVTPASPEKPVIPDNGKTSSTTNNNTTVNNTTNNNGVKTVKKIADALLPKTAAEKVGVSAIFAVVIAAITGGLIFKNRRNKQ